MESEHDGVQPEGFEERVDLRWPARAPKPAWGMGTEWDGAWAAGTGGRGVHFSLQISRMCRQHGPRDPVEEERCGVEHPSSVGPGETLWCEQVLASLSSTCPWEGSYCTGTSLKAH